MAGEILKAKREDLCLNIKEIADRLKIRADYLTAIEDDTYDILPAPVYTMGYIRSYAAYLGVDAEPVVSFYREHSSQPKHSTIVPIAHFRKKSPSMVYVLFLFAVLAAVLFFVRSSFFSRPVVTTQVNAGKEGAVNTVPAEHDVVNRSSAVPQEPEHTLVVTATALTWVAIRFQDGSREELTLQPGDTKSWQFTQEALLKIGNAGGIHIEFDGKDMGSPGPSGEVKSVAFPDLQNLSG